MDVFGYVKKKKKNAELDELFGLILSA